MKQFYFLLFIIFGSLFINPASAQVTLTGTSYSENFNGIASGLPAGFFISTSATATSPGTSATFNTAATAWNVTGAGFKNYASANGLNASSTSTDQSSSTDRALGVRQTSTAGTGGDPGAAVNFKIANTTGLQNLQLTFKLQSLDATSPRTTTWLVQYATGATPTSFTTVATVPSPLTTGGSSFTNNTITASFGSSLDNISDIVWIRIVALSLTTGSGNRATSAIDDFTLTYSSFGTGNSVSIAAGNNAAEPSTNGSFLVTLSTPAPAGGVTVTYALSGSATAGGDYTDTQNGSVFLPVGTTTKTIAITVIDDQQVEPTETIIATLSGVSTSTANYNINTTPATITLADNEGSVLQYYSFSTCSGSISDGFTAQSVSGAQVWSCTASGELGNGVTMNGYSGGNLDNQDWLVSPAVNLSSTNVPLLAFWSKSNFLGAPLQLYITTNYTGDVTTTTWTELNGRFPTVGSDLWTYSENIDLSAFKQANVRFAFKYTSTTAAASQWFLDEIYLFDAASVPPPSITDVIKIMDFREQNAGTTSASKTFSFWANDVSSNLTITAPAGFELSRDGGTFSSTISYTPAELLNTKITAYAHFIPGLANTSYGGYLNFAATGLNTAKVLIKGNSISAATRLNVVNWNLEWFGSTTPGNGPTDKNLQAANVKTAMEYLGADIYALEEVVDTALFGNMVRSLSGGYSYVVSGFGSSAYNPSDPSFAANYASAQKLALVYKNSIASNVTSRGLLLSSANAIANWSTGRVPFLVNLNATKNGHTTNLDFIVVHGKSGATQGDYDRRKAGAKELKDTLDAAFSTHKIIILGDYNDDFDQSIFTDNGVLLSSYDDIIKDSTDADSYKSVTLPLSYAALNSTVDNAEMIDHVVISNEVTSFYAPLTATLYNDIDALAGIANYGTTTTDHYPVMTQFSFTGTLPIHLLNFDAVKENASVRLSWTTTNEINAKEFIVERSKDGVNFDAIGKVTAAGDSNYVNTYGLLDAQPLGGNNYYRLRSVDNDGSFQLSAVVQVLFSKIASYTISPNPAHDYFIVNGIINQPLTVQIVDMNGRIVKETLLKDQPSKVFVNDLTKGVYIVKLISENNMQSQKLVVE